MPNLLIALVIAVGGYWLLRKFAKTPPQQVAALMRKVAGGACIALAGFLAFRGGAAIAVPLFIFGLGLMGFSSILSGNFPWNTKTPGQRSKVATGILSMELDHDTGQMDGDVLAGEFKGRKVASLSSTELQSLYMFCGKAGDQSLALLEAWLDRNRTGWREQWQQPSNGSRPRHSGAMSKEEALSVLGLKPGASEAEIRAAHKRLMKEFHPDRGGSDYLAAKINQAKDVLLQV